MTTHGFGVNYTAGGRFDPPFYPSKPLPFIKGHKLSAVAGNNVFPYTVPYDVEFIGVAVSCSKYETDDHWSLKYGSLTLIETSYTKDLPEGMFFTAFTTPKAGDVITFEFFNSGEAKDVWFNYQFLRDYPAP